jgi:hypothetical protein
VLEAGEVGRGVMGARDVVEHAKVRAGDEREVHYSSTAGSAVLPGPVNCVKMAIRCVSARPDALQGVTPCESASCPVHRGFLFSHSSRPAAQVE